MHFPIYLVEQIPFPDQHEAPQNHYQFIINKICDPFGLFRLLKTSSETRTPQCRSLVLFVASSEKSEANEAKKILVFQFRGFCVLFFFVFFFAEDTTFFGNFFNNVYVFEHIGGNRILLFCHENAHDHGLIFDRKTSAYMGFSHYTF